MIFLKKRAISFCLTANLLFLCLFGRLFSLTIYPQEVNVTSSLRTKEIAARQGYIYDRNLKPLTNKETYSKILIKPSKETFEYFKNDSSVIDNLKKGYFTIKKSETHLNINTENIAELPVFERYTDNIGVHILGYRNAQNEGVSGIEKYYSKELEEYGGILSVSYSVDGLGRHLSGEKTEIYDNGYYGKGGIILTISEEIQRIAENSLKRNKITKGAVVILDIKTNEIMACASSPTFQRDNLDSYLNDKDSPFLNRAFESYPVGSVFKIVTASATLENDVVLKNYFCSGNIEKSGRIFRCSNLEGHENVDLYSATANSCNPYFIELGNMIKPEILLETAKDLGFGKTINFGNGYKTTSGILPDINELNSSAAIGNLSFGQGKLTATPIQIAALFSTIANNGIYRTPTLIKGKTDGDGIPQYEKTMKGVRVLKESTCKIISKALLHTVKDGTGKNAYSEKVEICGKTSTAQSGQFDESGREIKQCWFAGYFPYENPQYAICVFKENGTAGGTDCAPTVKDIAEKILN